MSGHLFMPENLSRYIGETISRETIVQQRLRAETMQMPNANMLTTPDQVGFLQMLVKISGAKRVLEIGTFTGYSALAMALALPVDGKLVACDKSKKYTDIGRKYWQEAYVADKIEVRLGEGRDTIEALIKEGAQFDMAFIDADKGGYDFYYEACFQLMRPGGVITFDNMIWGGDVADDSITDRDTVALRELNAKIIQDERVDACLLTIADGIMLARVR